MPQDTTPSKSIRVSPPQSLFPVEIPLPRFLERMPGDLPYAVETRNPNYISRWHTYIEEFETVVIRLHGPDRLRSPSAGSKIFSPDSL